MKAKVTLGIAVILFGCSFHAFAQATAYANIYATVVAPVGIEKKADLTFSEIISSKNSNTVVLGTDNQLTASNIEVAQNGKGTVASFSITGSNQSTFDVTLPKETFTISDGGSNTMTVSNFTSTHAQLNTLQSNSNIIKIGATLHVPENQSAGSYNAQNPFLVTLNYN
jgi:hypothetical protein